MGTINWGMWEVLISITSLALSVLAVLIGLSSVLLYVWGKPWLEELVQREVKKGLETTERELRGRLVGYVGFIFGRLRDLNPAFLHSAIEYSALAYDTLPDESDYKMTALNNLAFYYSKRAYSTDAYASISHAKVILDDYGRSKDLDWLTTYASVVGCFHSHFENPKQVLLDTERMMVELQTRVDVSPTHKQSAARHLETIRAALRNYS